MTKDIIQSTTDQYINHGFQWSAFWLNAVNPKPEWLQLGQSEEEKTPLRANENSK